MPLLPDGRIVPNAVNLRVRGLQAARAAYDYAETRGFLRRL
jgi:hypothetical protein